MIPLKNRSFDVNKHVEVYRNLHDKDGTKKYSIRQNGLVIGHSNFILLNNAKFVVRQTGRERVIKEKRKNVHAFVKGRISLSRNSSDLFEVVKYNPYVNSSFVDMAGNPVKRAFNVEMNRNGVWMDRGF